MSITLGSSATAIGLSGMRAAQRQLDVRAHNVANLQTPGFQRQQLVQTAQPGVAGVSTALEASPTAPAENGFSRLAEDLVAQRVSVYSFAANLKSVQIQDQILGSLLDIRA